jgi:hypothetical protein
MKVIVAGNRYKDPEQKLIFDDYELVLKAINSCGFFITELVSGTAIGVDRLGEQWARTRSIPITEMSADWNQYGKRAGPARNKAMAEYADAAVIIWDGKSDGTRNMIDEMIRQKKPYHLQLTLSTLESFYE